ncbi:DUF4139 domain-containing protein [Streptomyces tritici]|uniref:DUF4139 domain-containing protein n=1 Tax=Streptomyces tritici TaxID=2054410 RepID=UPI003AF0D469
MTAGAVDAWESGLDAVVVYAQGALCRRVARGTVPQGGRVRVTGLPRSLDPGSLRARVVDGVGVRVTEARVEVEAGPRADEDADELRREAERLRDEHAATQARRDRQLARIKEIAALQPVPPGRKREDPPRATPVEAWLELADFVDERLAVLHAGLAELETTLRDLEHALDVAEDRLARASGNAPSAHVETAVRAVVALDGPAGAEVALELEYGVPGAVWVPAYRLTYRQGDGAGRLVLRASVAQRTGEDWTGVRLALATADLRRRTDLPRLRSVRIGRRQPAPAPSGWREPPAGLADLFAGYEAAGPAPAGPYVGGAYGGGVASVGLADTTELVGGAADVPMPPPPMPVAAPPAAPAYGAPLPVPGAAYGGPPPPAPAAAAPPAVRARPAGGGRPGGRTRSAEPQAPAGPAAPGMAAPSPPPEPVLGPPRPSGDELDYAALVLGGPNEGAGRRGLLFPDAPFDPVSAEHRRRAEAVAGLALPGHAVRPRTSAGSFDHRYDAAARVDIPSDGVWHTVTVGEIPIGLRTEYLCVPSVEPTVYATLVLSNATDQALLAGPVEVSLDGDFLLTAALPTLAPGGVRRVGLGPAEGIRVTRRTHLNESTAGLRNNVTVLDHQVHVELANGLARPVTVEVRERVPVTSEADVRIEERADWTKPRDDSSAEHAPEHHSPGTRLWRVELPAGGTAALDGGYEIRIPAGKALVGGNRRS